MNRKRRIEDSKVLVTGGGGFIGSNLVETLLKQNNFVVCLDNFATGKRKNIERFLPDIKFKLVEGDIRNSKDCIKAVEDVDVVLHQAALGSVPRSIKDPNTSNDVNIGGFVNMLTAAKDRGIKRFVYASSSSVYGDAKDLPKYEDKVGKPLSPYAITKYVNELYAENFAKLYGMKIIGLRYFNVFGKQQDPNGAYAAVIPKFIKSFMKHESPAIHGDGEQSRDFTYIENVVQANQLAALTDNPKAVNTVYNVAFGDKATVNELFHYLRENLSRFDEAISTVEPDYGPERAGDVKHSLASIDKAKTLLGYQPEFSLSDGLEIAIEWYWNDLKNG